ncbi:thiamine-phosphate kinase [Geoglobus acetivorans]|uniref:Thiamine-monophosphate kinase n=1 Tax=Geoglobus acetivorans TaxID=565033 RepID=A0A0A7GJ67_GEOAI|nr:Thiamine-monophosphate kinase [Geoglobus acetivorans]
MEEDIIRAGLSELKRKSEVFGDDAGAFRAGDGWLVITNDMLVESTDVVASMSPEDVGFRVVTMNASDLAAMGARPLYFAFSVGLKESDERSARKLFRGIQRGLEMYGMSLISADTNQSNELILDGIAVGMAESLMLRKNARPGELVCVTGELGKPLSALLIELKGMKADEGLRKKLYEKFLRPVARVEEGVKLTDLSRCAIDISDGMVKELRAISEASGAGIVIWEGELPISDEVREFCRINGLDEHLIAMNSGEEYELIFTIDRDKISSLEIEFTVVGEVVRGKGVWIRRGEKTEQVRDFSWRHFSRGLL